jgi:hypothetical protein
VSETLLRTENPLFDEWVKAMGPHFDHERKWLGMFFNPPLEALLALERAGNGDVTAEMDWMLTPIRARHELVTKYAWAVPTEEALETIKRYSEDGLIEIGAGTGYWTGLLRARGVDVVAFDRDPYKSSQADARWSEVLKGTPLKVRSYPERTLFLCWPPYKLRMAERALHHYAGDTVIYIGEGPHGCTADDLFHDKLATGWEEAEYIGLPQWPGIRDGLYIYRRKGS